jgi:hypothetical protein
MPTAICENDAAEKDKTTIANNSHRTAARFVRIARPPNFVPTFTRSSAQRHCAAKHRAWPVTFLPYKH